MSEPASTPAVQLDDVTFSYPQALVGQGRVPVLLHASMTVPEGAFALLEGDTGSGKTTLMRLMKPEVTPAGELSGTVHVLGQDVRALDAMTSATQIGLVFQSPENQIVCDTVWHELAFGLENIGVDEQDMRLRIAETCQFLGMEGLFRKHCHELSGGQRQLVALASVLVMRPRVLLLDEPTSQLDPVAEKGFLALLFRVNRELGVTVIVATHRPEPMIPYATCAYRISSGRVRPVALGAVPKVTAVTMGTAPRATAPAARPAVALEDVWFRYTRDADWVLRGCDLSVCQGEVRALMGGNGSGKSTLLALAAGIEKPRRGRVKRPLASSQALLPQAPRALLACETVEEELLEWSRSAGYGVAEVDEALGRLGLANARSRHPYDLSQGQQQLLALEKLLLTKPALLLLDEPTKGLDAHVRSVTIMRIAEAAAVGTTVVVATHDVGFVRDACQTVSLLFDGQTVLTCDVPAFLAASWIYGDMR